MARVLITGSTDGLGLMAAELLLEQGHRVVLHARNAQRARAAGDRLPAADAMLIGDLASMAETRDLAAAANRLGRFDAVIHNAAVGYGERARVVTGDGLPQIFQVNVLAPYLLSTLIATPGRQIYVSSGVHLGAELDLDDLAWTQRPWRAAEAYAESKLLLTMLALAAARQWPGMRCNAVEPGWVATRMGGPGAPDDLELGPLTQVWLAVSEAPAVQVSGRNFYHQREHELDPRCTLPSLQQRLLAFCREVSGVGWA